LRDDWPAALVEDAANGFQLPDDELASFGNASGYLTATLAE
jgi:hypothetical protein